MTSLKDLVAEHNRLLGQYKTFPREWFRKPGETAPPFSYYRSPELIEHDEKLKAVAQKINEHPDHRDLEPDFVEALGERIANDKDFAQKAYASLCNVDWVHEKGTVDGYSWRSAGDLIADIRNKSVGKETPGDVLDKIGQNPSHDFGAEIYLDWYCSGNEGTVDPEIEELMAGYGWHPHEL